MARQIGPAERLMQSMHSLKASTAKMDLPRMPNGRFPKKVSYGELQKRKRSQGGKKKRYKDTLNDFDISTGSWEHRRDKSGEVSSTKDPVSKKTLKRFGERSFKKAQRTQSKDQWTTSRFHDVDFDLHNLQPAV